MCLSGLGGKSFWMPTSVINSLSLLKWPLFSLCMHVPFNTDVVKNPVMIIDWDNGWKISVISLGKRLYRGKQTLETKLRKQKPLYLHFHIHFCIVLCHVGILCLVWKYVWYFVCLKWFFTVRIPIRILHFHCFKML